MILYQGNSDDGKLFLRPIIVFLKFGATKLGKCAAFFWKED